MLGDAHGARGGTHGLRRLLGGQSDHHAQHQDLSLLLGEHLEQLAHLVGQLDPQRTLLGTVRDLDRSGTSATGSDRLRVAGPCASITLCDAMP